MNIALEKISQREFGANEFIFDFKKAKVRGMAGTTKKKDLKQSMERLKGILK